MPAASVPIASILRAWHPGFGLDKQALLTGLVGSCGGGDGLCQRGGAGTHQFFEMKAVLFEFRIPERKFAAKITHLLIQHKHFTDKVRLSAALTAPNRR